MIYATPLRRHADDSKGAREASRRRRADAGHHFAITRDAMQDAIFHYRRRA